MLLVSRKLISLLLITRSKILDRELRISLINWVLNHFLKTLGKIPALMHPFMMFVRTEAMKDEICFEILD